MSVPNGSSPPVTPPASNQTTDHTSTHDVPLESLINRLDCEDNPYDFLDLWLRARSPKDVLKAFQYAFSSGQDEEFEQQQAFYARRCATMEAFLTWAKSHSQQSGYNSTDPELRAAIGDWIHHIRNWRSTSTRSFEYLSKVRTFPTWENFPDDNDFPQYMRQFNNSNLVKSGFGNSFCILLCKLAAICTLQEAVPLFIQCQGEQKRRLTHNQVKEATRMAEASRRANRKRRTPPESSVEENSSSGSIPPDDHPNKRRRLDDFSEMNACEITEPVQFLGGGFAMVMASKTRSNSITQNINPTTLPNLPAGLYHSDFILSHPILSLTTTIEISTSATTPQYSSNSLSPTLHFAPAQPTTFDLAIASLAYGSPRRLSPARYLRAIEPLFIAVAAALAWEADFKARIKAQEEAVRKAEEIVLRRADALEMILSRPGTGTERVGGGAERGGHGRSGTRPHTNNRTSLPVPQLPTNRTPSSPPVPADTAQPPPPTQPSEIAHYNLQTSLREKDLERTKLRTLRDELNTSKQDLRSVGIVRGLEALGKILGGLEAAV